MSSSLSLSLSLSHTHTQTHTHTLTHLDIMVGQRRELLNSGEHVDELRHALAKEVELAEDVALIKIKLLHLGLRAEV
jgi:hypothetical protein